MKPVSIVAGCMMLVALGWVPATVMAAPEHPWGAAQPQVRASAGGELVVAVPGRLIHHGTYRGVPVTVNRRFDDDGGLRQVRYFNRSTHAEPVDYLSDFDAFRRGLIVDHGEPELSVREWRSATLREQPGMEGMGLAGNKLVLITAWETSEAVILMTLQREHMAMGHRLVFTDPEADAEAFPRGR